VKCNECKYWEPLDIVHITVQLGICRIDSPKIRPEDPFGLAIWPKTKNTDWCGDFWAKDDDTLEFLQGGERRSAVCDN
jgi:hypothetical protein